jgi:hypothetical protein
MDTSISDGFPTASDGSHLAIVIGVDNKLTTRQRGGITSFARVIRGFVEASLVALGFAFAILLIGTPTALIARGLHEGLSWLARLRGDLSTFAEALVSASSVAGGIVLAVVFVRLLVGFFNWRRRVGARVLSGDTQDTRLDRQEIARAA